jgi:hypothetical protein
VYRASKVTKTSSTVKSRTTPTGIRSSSQDPPTPPSSPFDWGSGSDSDHSFISAIELNKEGLLTVNNRYHPSAVKLPASLDPTSVSSSLTNEQLQTLILGDPASPTKPKTSDTAPPPATPSKPPLHTVRAFFPTNSGTASSTRSWSASPLQWHPPLAGQPSTVAVAQNRIWDQRAQGQGLYEPPLQRVPQQVLGRAYHLAPAPITAAFHPQHQLPLGTAPPLDPNNNGSAKSNKRKRLRVDYDRARYTEKRADRLQRAYRVHQANVLSAKDALLDIADTLPEGNDVKAKLISVQDLLQTTIDICTRTVRQC